jgi:putative membrane protein
LSVANNISEATGKETQGVLSLMFDEIDTKTANGIFILLTVVMFISLLVSSIRVLLRYANLLISRSDKGFNIRHGLIHTKEKLVSFGKIQYISWKANWVRKKMGVFLLHFHIAGSDEIKERMEIRVPAMQPAFINEILKDYHLQLPADQLTPLRINITFILRKIIVNGLFLSSFIFCISWFIIGGYAALAFLLIPYVGVTGYLFQRNFRFWAVEDALQIKKGVFGTETAVLKWNKIQAVYFNQSILQQRKKLATLKLFTAGGMLEIPFIKVDEALTIFNYALFKIESGQ